MNPSDDDLNGLLMAWTAPRSPASLERRVRRAYRDRTRSRPRWIGGFVPAVGKFAGFVAAAVVLLAVITRAFPQSLGVIAPPGAITIDSEFIRYKDDGSSTVSEYRTSSISSIEGETVLSRSFPGDPLRTAAGELFNPVKSILGALMQRMGRTRNTRGTRELATAVAARIRNGCAPTNHWAAPMTVIGKETILNYTTTVSQYQFKDERFTEWFAPGLDCVSLRSTTEKALADGAFRLASERRAVKVTRNPRTTAAKEPNR